MLYNGPTDQNIPTKDTFENGHKGTRVLRFNKNNTVSPQDIHQQEIDFQKQTGQDVRFTDMDPEQLKQMVNNPDYYFYWEIVPTDKNNDKITQAFFITMITQAAQLFGPQSLKVQNLKQRYAQVMGEKFDDLFLSQEEMAMQQQQQGPQEEQGERPAPSPVPSDVRMPAGMMK